MKHTPLLLLLLLSSTMVTVFAEPVSLATPTVKVGSSNNFPPVNMLDENGQLTGFGRDISNAVFNDMGVKVERRHSSIWTEVEGWLLSGEVDVLHDTGFNQKRARYLEYSSPILEMQEQIFVRKNRHDIYSLSSLRGKRVACVRNHITHIYLKTIDGIQCKVVETPVEGVYALVSNEVDAFVFPDHIATYYIQSLGLENKIKITGEPIRTLRWAMTVKKDNTKLLSDINQSIRNIKDSGEYRDIYNKWFGRNIMSGYDDDELRTFAAIVFLFALFSGITIGLIFYNRRLHGSKQELESVVTDLINTKEVLGEMNDRFQSLAQNIPGAVYQILIRQDGSFSMPYISDGIEKLTGIPASTVMSDPEYIFSHIHKQDVGKIFEFIEKEAPLCTPWRDQFRLVHEDGAVKWIKGAATPSRLANGDVIYNGILLENTRLKEAQDQLKQAHGELEHRVGERTHELTAVNAKLRREIQIRKRTEEVASANEARYRSIFECVLDAIVTSDETGVIESMNQSAERMLGYSESEVVGKNIDVLLPDNIKEMHSRSISDYLRTGEIQIMDVTRERHVRKKDGAILPVEISLTDMQLNGKHKFVMFMRDIHERKHIEELKDEFISTVSHELRTPLTSIRGALGLIENRVLGDVPDEVREMLEIASSNSIRLARLVDEIIDLEKVKDNALEIRHKELNLDALLKGLLADHKAVAKKANQKLNYIVPDKKICVFADKESIITVLTNFISNAMKYSDEGKDVTVVVEKVGRNVRIKVIDQGIGISPSFQSRVFQRFAREDATTTRKKNGSGLGLSICKAIMDKHGEKIGFITDKDKGSCFYIDLKQC